MSQTKSSGGDRKSAKPSKGKAKPAKPTEAPPGDIPIGATAPADEPSLQEIEQAGVAGYAEQDGANIDAMVPQTVQVHGILPEDEEAFYARDPFSADYADFLKYKGDARRAEKRARIDEGLRASLLEKPMLMDKPEEAAHRGAAAVWRSLKDQLHQELEKLIDVSDETELDALERDIASRRTLVAAVSRGLDMLLERVRQRRKALAEATDDDLPPPQKKTG